MSALCVDLTTSTDSATCPDTAQVEQTPTQPLIATNTGLQNSPFGRLPPELRNKIFAIALSDPIPLVTHEPDPNSMSAFFSDQCVGRQPISCPHISDALNIVATCQQIRSETSGLLLSLNDICICSHLNIDDALQQLQRSTPLLKKLPSSLGSNSGRVVLRVGGIVYHQSRRTNLDEKYIPSLRGCLARSARAIHPLQLSVRLVVAYHAWYVTPCLDKVVCNIDAPITLIGCSHVHIIMSLDGRTAALSRIDEVVNSKLELLRRQRFHRLCPVRAMLRQFEPGLEEARQFMRRVVDVCTSEVPDDMTNVVGT